MRLPSTVVAALLAVTVTLAAPVDPSETANSLREEQLPRTSIESLTESAANGTAEDGLESDKVYWKVFCERDETGPKMDILELFTMKVCWYEVRSARWGWVIYDCPTTPRNFNSWGWHWETPAHCYNACDPCISKAIDDGIPAVNCFTEAGPMAYCVTNYNHTKA